MLSACRDPAPSVPAVIHRDSSVIRRDSATTHPAPQPAVVVVPSLPTHTSVDVTTQPQGFLGLNDQVILQRICNDGILRYERNRGGSTVSFKIRLDGNQKALFKPQQRAQVANFRAELAAYRMSKLLGLHRVPPACGRLVNRAALQHTADASGDATFSQRVMTELLGRDDSVPGAVLYWVPGALEPVPGVEGYATLLDVSHPLLPTEQTLAADLSSLLVFDFLNDNVDRWSGGNILRQRTQPGDSPAPMLYMDNGASFSALNDGLGARPDDQRRRLESVGKFSRSLIDRLRGLTADNVRDAMAADPLGPCLSDAQIRAVLVRRDRVIARVDALLQTHDATEVLPFP
jgi:hypothetical protein